MTSWLQKHWKKILGGIISALVLVFGSLLSAVQYFRSVLTSNLSSIQLNFFQISLIVIGLGGLALIAYDVFRPNKGSELPKSRITVRKNIPQSKPSFFSKFRLAPKAPIENRNRIFSSFSMMTFVGIFMFVLGLIGFPASPPGTPSSLVPLNYGMKYGFEIVGLGLAGFSVFTILDELYLTEYGFHNAEIKKWASQFDDTFDFVKDAPESKKDVLYAEFDGVMSRLPRLPWNDKMYQRIERLFDFAVKEIPKTDPIRKKRILPWLIWACRDGDTHILQLADQKISKLTEQLYMTLELESVSEVITLKQELLNYNLNVMLDLTTDAIYKWSDERLRDLIDSINYNRMTLEDRKSIIKQLWEMSQATVDKGDPNVHHRILNLWTRARETKS
jgi:hypothetical protein